MTSYVYNPSGKVTELLSQYLEFDPEQLQLGIWSGNLTLSNVNLRQEAVQPWLNNRTTPLDSQHQKPPLQLRLVSGKIGSLSMKIPWKSLVWGQGDVQVDLRNIVITLALDADTALHQRSTKKQQEPDVDQEQQQPTATQFPRDKKQKLLRDAEKRLVQNRLLGPWLQAVKRKEEEEQAKKRKVETASSADGAFVKWLRSISSDFFWRFCVGLQMSVENIKVIILQDGVEIGLLVPSCKVVPQKTETDAKKSPANPETESLGSEHTNPLHDDGEQVDKQLRVVGVGLYVRTVAEGQSFPADIYTTDYVLRPVDVNFDFSLFFPLPPDKRKKRALKPEEETASGNIPTMTSPETSAKRRRGKRDKQTDILTETTVPTTQTSTDIASPMSGNIPISPLGVPISPKRIRRSNRRFSASASPLVSRQAGLVRLANSPALPLAQPDDIEAAYSSRTRSFGQTVQTARFDGKLNIGAIHVVCSTTHYRLINLFLASSARIRNGRPRTTIRSSLQRYHESLNTIDRDDSSGPGESTSRNSELIVSKGDVVRSWWRYVFDVLDWEVQQRRRLRLVFQQKYLTFNWNAQRYKRKEYVNLFISLHLEKPSHDGDRPTSSQQPLLLKLEDELPIEQILLYRAIARSVHVRGGRKMPSSILRLKWTDGSAVKKPAVKRGVSSGPMLYSDEVQGFVATLAARCEVARARLNADVTEKAANFERIDETLDLRHSELEEEGSYDLDYSESRTIRTQRSVRSTGFSVAATAMDSANLNDPGTGMFFAFCVSVQRLTLMIVGDENRSNGYGPSGFAEAEKNDPFSSDTLSVLTDDHRFDAVEETSIAVEESETSDRIFPSSDFLLFKVPEKVILRLDISGLNCVSLGRSGGSRNLNFSIGRIEATGINSVSLFRVGAETRRDAPLDEIKLPTAEFGLAPLASSVPRNALSLSIIGRAQTHFVQCDAPVIMAVLHLKTLESLMCFVKNNRAILPSPMLPRSPRGELRLYILHQNQMLFTGVNCSVRVHGCHITVPISRHADGINDKIDLSERSFTNREALSLTCDMIEMYSGGAVEDLSASMQSRREEEHEFATVSSLLNSKPVTTRRLSMLDVPGILLSSDSPLSSHWVFTASGINVNVTHREQCQMLVEAPVDVEILYTFNGDSLLDSNRARHEYVVEVSPLLFLMIPNQFKVITTVAQIFSDVRLLAASETRELELPRLEVLSKFMLYSVDLSLQHFRLAVDYCDEIDTVPLSRAKQMEESLVRFLSVVSRYDLSFPHEDALAVSMQTCIDGLVGIGLNSEEAWEVSNLAMLKFLEEITDCSNNEGSERDDPTSPTSDNDLDLVETTVNQIALQTASSFEDNLEFSNPLDGQYTLVAEFPDGMSISTVSLFYDSNVSLGIPIMTLGSGVGGQHLRITPSEIVDEDSLSSTRKGGCGAQKRTAPSSGAAFGVSLQVFRVDEKSDLGKGGLPLIALGGDSLDDPDDICSLEQLCDLELGDVELFVSGKSCNELIRLCDVLMDSFSADQSHDVSGIDEQRPVVNNLLATFSTISVVFSCEAFFPFARVACSDCKLKYQMDGSAGGEVIGKLQGASTQIELTNLLPEGDLHPTAISNLPGSSGCVATFSIGDEVSVVLRSIRVVFLKQFLGEIMQFFHSEQYELGAVLSKLKSSTETIRRTVSVTILDSSFIIPKSSSSFEMICFEVEQVQLNTSLHEGSFSVPTNGSPLKLEEPCGSIKEVQRLTVSLRDAQLFTSSGTSPESLNSSSFRYFYELNGRANSEGLVFRRRPDIGVNMMESNLAASSVMTGRQWAECTPLFSLDIVIDHAPHFRLLITDPLLSPKSSGLHLDFSEQDFCLLLSIWFVNLQELPVMLPYTAGEFYSWSLGGECREEIPQYGTSGFRSYLESSIKPVSEFMISLEEFSFRCRKDDGILGNHDQPLKLSFYEALVHVSVDDSGTTRIGSGSSYAQFEMGSTYSLLSVGDRTSRVGSWADHRFGLGCEMYEDASEKGLPQPFQLSIWMSPSWTTYNLGLRSPTITLPSLKPIVDLIDFVSLYFTDKRRGNPYFKSLAKVTEWHHEITKSSSTKRSYKLHSKGGGIDFYLWAPKPHVTIPCLPFDKRSPCILLSGEGLLWYKFASVESWQSQECVLKGLEVSFDNYHEAHSGAERVSTIVSNVSMGLRLDRNEAIGHTDLCLQMPYPDQEASELFNSRITVKPHVEPRPTICSPPLPPTERRLGLQVCEVTYIAHAIPLMSTTLLNLLGGSDGSSNTLDTTEATTAHPEHSTFSYCISFRGFRFFVLDPVLGRHLPLVVLTVSSLSFTASRFLPEGEAASVQECPRNQPVGDDTPHSDLQLMVSATCWMDHFKLGLTRNWEPLVEASSFSGLYERSKHRGSGMSFKSDDKLHINASSAFVGGIQSLAATMSQLVKGGLGVSTVGKNVSPAFDRLQLAQSCGELEIEHEVPPALDNEFRVPFSVCNLSGGRLRISQCRQRSEHKTRFVYLDQRETIKLDFQPTVTNIENLRTVEVVYPGLSDCKSLPPHTLDIQLEGFRWIRVITVDSIGRKFADLRPKIPDVQAEVNRNWQLQNVMKVLVETGLQSGGRRLDVKSIFTVVNNTDQDMDMVLSPVITTVDASPHNPDADKQLDPPEKIKAGASRQIPALLLEAALQIDPSSLGYASIKPSNPFVTEELARVFFDSNCLTEQLEVGFSSNPLNLFEIVSESAAIFDARGGHNIREEDGKTGLQSPCPVRQKSGARLGSFFLQIEIARSPIVRRNDDSSNRHGPILYTLSINAPIVVTNLLPKRGRFVLKHAFRHTVVWYGDLEPGEKASVHTVGLDAPLLLFANLGFAKTPQGLGCLVHHGIISSDSARGNLIGLKSIGKAGKAMTKQLGRTLTSMGESPNESERAGAIASSTRDKLSSGLLSGSADELNDKMHDVEKFHFLPEEIDEEIIVVDCLGQMLKLEVENVRGGGGQRHVTIFCSFWLVNTTEHSLRYKQDNCKHFVSGTVHSPVEDGSKMMRPDEPSSISSSNWFVDDTGFAGKPGALSSYPGRCSLDPEVVSSLLDKNMSFDDLTKSAFMFNFLEGSVMGIGNQKLCVQLGDGTGRTNYTSDWSRGISLDSVGIAQVVGIHCKDGRMLEINVVVHVASGLLSNKTKIVRFLPRFVVVNNLSVPIRLWQDNSLFQPIHQVNSETIGSSSWNSFRRYPKHDATKVSQYEFLWGRHGTFDNVDDWEHFREPSTRRSALHVATLAPGDVMPFSLPDSRRDRQLRVDLGSPWDLTASVSADTPGDHCVRVSPLRDVESLPHVSTRSSPQFEVRISPDGDNPPDGDLGVWFETGMDSSQQVIVKAIKKGAFAFNCTDIHIGDELLAIDGVGVSRMSFPDTMKFLKRRLLETVALQKRRSFLLEKGEVSTKEEETEDKHDDTLVITFRSVEERLRLVRMKAAKSNSSGRRTMVPPDTSASGHSALQNRSTDDEYRYLKLEMKTFERSDVGMFVVVSKELAVPFRVRNQSIGTTVCYRQKGCNHHPWRHLKPGQSTSYAWEEPLKPKRLSVRIMLIPDPGKLQTRNKLKDEEESIFTSPVSIRLEEIGFEEVLALPNQQGRKGYVKLAVDVETLSRVLVISDVPTSDGSKSVLHQHLDLLTARASEESSRLEALRTIDIDEDSGDENLVARMVNAMVTADDEQSRNIITGCHQLIVSVEEATGLNSGSLVGSCNPYAEIRLKGCHDPGRRVLLRKDLRKTVYVKDTTNPVWKGQTFVFTVSPDAVRATRGCAVQVKIRSFRVLGRHAALGRTRIDLNCLRDQKPKEGWFQLSGRSGRQELESERFQFGKGSVKLRIQWIYSPQALVLYHIGLSEKRSTDLQERKNGLERQIENKEALERQRGEESDNFKPLTFQQLLSLSKSNMKLRAAQIQKMKKPLKKLIDPLRVVGEKSSRSSSKGSRHSRDHGVIPSVSPILDGGMRKRLNSSSGFLQTIEDQISETRQAIQRFNPPRPRFESSQTVESDYIKLPLGVFKSWSLVHAVNDNFLVSTAEGEIKIQLEDTNSELDGDDYESPISRCLSVPLGVPVSLRRLAHEAALSFEESRISVDRAARMTLRTILNPGGWLKIRPITAMNLPDGFTEMFVKVNYGSEELVTGNTNSSVPEWSRPNGMDTTNDIHIHVAPQKTSGSIRVSVVGDKKSQQIHSKVELGVVFLPLGRTIAACVSESEYSSSSTGYTGWFPLKNPKDLSHSEGDAGLSSKPNCTEKLENRLLESDFSPYLKLALIWSPELESDAKQVESTLLTHPHKIPPIQSYFTANFSRISLVLIDSDRAKELLAFNALDLDLHYWATKAKTRIGMSIGWVQVDYQDEDSREPVVLVPSQGNPLTPVVETLAVKDNAQSVREVSALDFVDISIAEFDISIEENLLLDLLSFFGSVGRGGMELTKSDSDAKEYKGAALYTMLTERKEAAREQKKKLYIRQLFLGVLRVNLSYLKGRRSQAELNRKQRLATGHNMDESEDVLLEWTYRKANVHDDKEKHTKSVRPTYLTNLVPNVSNAPIRLPGKSLTHIFQSPAEILKWIRRYYITEVVKQVYRILGSLDFVGNPTMLVMSFFSGVRDMVVAPSVALLNSPTDPSKAGLIFAKGTLSLVSHSTSGFFGTLAKVSASAGQGVATMSLDSDFREWHRSEVLADATRDWNKRGMQNIGRMVGRPIVDVVIGVTGGVSGVVLSPVKGYRKNGSRGLIEGTVIGLIGLFAKPVVGLLDSFSHFAGSVHDIAKSVNVLEKRVQPAKRLRLPYSFAVMSILSAYDENSARAQNLLKRFPVHSKGDDLGLREVIVHAEILASVETETFIIATTHRVVVARVVWDSNGVSTSVLCWQGLFSDTQSIESMIDQHDLGHGSSLTLRTCGTECIDRSPKTSRFDTNQQQRTPLSSFRVGFVAPRTKGDLNAREPPAEDGLGKENSVEKMSHAEDQFTVFGEYRFRHQMISIHNAISCVAQRFDRLSYDESHNTDALFFGPFYFCERLSTDSDDHYSVPQEIEDVPWVTRSTLVHCQSMTSSEQKLYVDQLRDNWTVRKEIEFSRGEGGPEWLVDVRARSRFVESSGDKRRTLQVTKRLSRHGDDCLEPNDSNSESSPIPIPTSSLHRYFTAGTSSDNPLNSKVLGNNSSHRDSPSDYDSDSFQRGYPKHRDVYSSFATAQTNRSLGRSPLSPSSAIHEEPSRLERIERVLEQMLTLTMQGTNRLEKQATDYACLEEQINDLRTELNGKDLRSQVAALQEEVKKLQCQLGSVLESSSDVEIKDYMADARNT